MGGGVLEGGGYDGVYVSVSLFLGLGLERSG